MQDLRLIGVHEDGEHLLLSDADGQRYRVPLDEQLRVAARGDRPRLGQLQIEIEGGLRPREIQALIRSGLSAAEVADRSGWTVEKVQRFEGPVLAEREFIASRARAAQLSHDSGRQTLEQRANERLRGRGVDLDAVTWDSLRHDSGQWIVTATFPAGGRQRTASWRFDPVTVQVRPQNDDARWLGEDERVGPLPAPHVAGGATRSEEVFDVTAPTRGAGAGGRAAARPVGADEDELTESLRSHHSSLRTRRGRRRISPAQAPGDHLSPVDALPLEPLVGDPEVLGPPPDRPRPGHGEPSEPSAPPAPAARTTPTSPPAEAVVDDEGERTAYEESRGEETAPSTEAGGPSRKGRRSVPSWDDVVFGTRPRPPAP
ncbi:MAG: DUF3071 domain-containing protein [Actinobacteria bacterium]|nr:DUF3071 domain-containing protein [Actinomycetota bacterium]